MPFTAAALFLAALASSSAAVPIIQTTSGPILGLPTSTGGAAYLGVPYAQADRFGPPRPPTPWTSPYNATSYASSCISFAASSFDAGDQAEACNVVQVWVPSANATTPGRPVIVWIHGGGFVGGSSQGDLSGFAEGTGALIVSVEYRLGSLGFLDLAGMEPAEPPPAGAGAACANVGLLDQQAALLWVRANAAAFGADPEHVLITGESAGGSSILFQLTLEGSYGAYRAALSQSPGSPVNTHAKGQATAAAIAAKLGCAGGYAAQLACLRTAAPAALHAAAVAVAGTDDLPLTLGPVIDGALVRAAPATAILAGEFNRDASVLVSQTLFEGDSLLVGFTHSVVLTPAESAAALQQLGTSCGLDEPTMAAVGAAYAPIAARDGNFNASSREWGDGLIGCATRWGSRGAARHSRHPVRRFLFNTTAGGQPAGRATHGTDVGFIFGNGSPISSDWHAWLANIAVTGDVNVGPKPVAQRWPDFTADGGDILVVNERHEYSTVPAWQEELCDEVWLPILP